MNLSPQPDTSKRRLFWLLAGGGALLLWTALMHYRWLEWKPIALHYVPAFFLGLLVLVLIIGAVAMVRSLHHAPKAAPRVRSFQFTLGWGTRWLFSREPWLICGWILVLATSVVALFYNVELWRGKRAWVTVERQIRARGESLDVKEAIPAPEADAENFAMAPPFVPLLAMLIKPDSVSEEDWRGNLGSLENVAKWGDMRPSGKQIEGGIAPAPWLDQLVTDFRGWLEALDPAQLDQDASQGPEFKPLAPDIQTSPEHVERVLEALQPFNADLSQLREFSSHKSCRFPLDYPRQMFSKDQVTPVMTGYLRILSLQACARLALRQDEAALNDVHLILRLMDYARQQPWVMAAHRRLLVFTEAIQPIWEGLQSHRWSPAQLEPLQNQLENLLDAGLHGKVAPRHHQRQAADLPKHDRWLHPLLRRDQRHG
jgi:hypothetical protein